MLLAALIFLNAQRRWAQI